MKYIHAESGNIDDHTRVLWDGIGSRQHRNLRRVGISGAGGLVGLIGFVGVGCFATLHPGLAGQRNEVFSLLFSNNRANSFGGVPARLLSLSWLVGTLFFDVRLSKPCNLVGSDFL